MLNCNKSLRIFNVMNCCPYISCNVMMINIASVYLLNANINSENWSARGSVSYCRPRIVIIVRRSFLDIILQLILSLRMSHIYTENFVIYYLFFITEANNSTTE